jgi:hypothetical protein
MITNNVRLMIHSARNMAEIRMVFFVREPYFVYLKLEMRPIIPNTTVKKPKTTIARNRNRESILGLLKRVDNCLTPDAGTQIHSLPISISRPMPNLPTKKVGKSSILPALEIESHLSEIIVAQLRSITYFALYGLHNYSKKLGFPRDPSKKLAAKSLMDGCAQILGDPKRF